jgi:hypothetical protein
MNLETARLFRTFSDLFKKPFGPIREYYSKLSHEDKEKFVEQVRRAVKHATGFKPPKKGES